MTTKSDYDGFYFLPGEKDDTVEFSFFKFKDDKKMGDLIEDSPMGAKYHVLFLKDNDGEIEFDDHFEAIFADPLVYVKNLYGSGIYGTFLKKTEKSGDWWDNYLKTTLDSVIIDKMKDYAGSIANSK